MPSGREAEREPALPDLPAGATSFGPAWLSVLGSPYLLLVLNMAIWGLNWVVARAVHDQVGPLELVFYRWTAGLIVLLPFVGGRLWRLRRVIWREWRIILLLSGTGIVIFNYLIYRALQTTTATNGSLITATQPVVIVLVSWVIFRERVSRRQALGIVVSLAGAGIIVAHGDLGRLLRVHFNAGDLWSLVAMPVWSIYSVMLRRRPVELSGVELLTAMILFGVVMMLPFYLAFSARDIAHLANPSVLWAVAYVGLFSSVAGYILWNAGVAAINANVAGQFVYLVPVFAALFAFLFLGETLSLYHLGGVILIFGGIYLTTYSQSTEPAPGH